VTARAAPDPDRLAAAFARCLGGPEGATVLGHLRRITIERRLSPAASDRELWHLEGQRFLAILIANLVERGASEPRGRAPLPRTAQPTTTDPAS
jgi:hypothetical protein